jgi:hypothetical protein
MPKPSPKTSTVAGIALRVLAAAYLAGVWLDGSGTTLPSRVLPHTLNYFLQIAALFPRAATKSIDYRAEAYVCREHAWTEIDTRPYFRVDAEEKENRFHRAMQFYREEATAMHALDAYLVDAHGSGGHDDGVPHDAAIGGVRLMSLRIPLPKPGDALERVRRKPLADYPEDERHVFYHTPKSTLRERCRAAGGEEGSP